MIDEETATLRVFARASTVLRPEGFVLIYVDDPRSMLAVKHFSPPDELRETVLRDGIPGSAIWVNWSVGFGDPPKKGHRVGIAFAQIFAPINEGDRDALELADKISGAFCMVTEGGISYRLPNLARVGERGMWWQTNVRCPFRCQGLS